MKPFSANDSATPAARGQFSFGFAQLGRAAPPDQFHASAGGIVRSTYRVVTRIRRRFAHNAIQLKRAQRLSSGRISRSALRHLPYFQQIHFRRLWRCEAPTKTGLEPSGIRASSKIDEKTTRKMVKGLGPSKSSCRCSNPKPLQTTAESAA